MTSPTNNNTTTPTNPEHLTHLIRHFQSQYNDVQAHPSGWSNLWDTDNSHLWDRGGPSPALIDLVEERRDLFDPFSSTSTGTGENGSRRRKRAFVPGCGKGYDVVMLALHGFDVWGLDISETGVEVAREYAKAELASPQAYNFGKHWGGNENENTTTTTTTTPGKVTFIAGDFFDRAWEAGIPQDESESGLIQFDLIYDYTFLCALHPTTRPQWATRMAQLTKPGSGLLVCLEFPMYKDPKLPGPPWGLKGVHWDLLAEGGSGDVGARGEGEGGSSGEKGEFRRILYVKPARSYESGRGVDMLSVYERKRA